MKKFFEALQNKPKHVYDGVPSSSNAVSQAALNLRKHYQQNLGKRALYFCKSEKYSRIVTIKQVLPRYVLLEYKYGGVGYSGKMRTCVNYTTLLCGDDRLDLR